MYNLVVYKCPYEKIHLDNYFVPKYDYDGFISVSRLNNTNFEQQILDNFDDLICILYSKLIKYTKLTPRIIVRTQELNKEESLTTTDLSKDLFFLHNCFVKVSAENVDKWIKYITYTNTQKIKLLIITFEQQHKNNFKLLKVLNKTHKIINFRPLTTEKYYYKDEKEEGYVPTSFEIIYLRDDGEEFYINDIPRQDEYNKPPFSFSFKVKI